MNRIMIYIGIAILLGSITMVVPITLITKNYPLQGTNNVDIIPGNGSSDPERSFQNGASTESNDSLLAPESPSDSSGLEQNKLTFGNTETSSDLSAIGWMTIPSFLFAFGIFILIRKRIS